MKRKLNTFFALTFFLTVTSVGCMPTNELQERYGENSYYFIGLQAKERGDTKQAQRYLKNASSKSQPMFARLAEMELTELGTPTEQTQSAINFQKKYNDESSLLFATQILFNHGELSQIIKITEGIDLAAVDNEVAYYRVYSLYKKNNPHFHQEYYDWCTKRSFTSWHYKLYCEVEEMNEVISFRANIYTRDYGKAYLYAQYILEESKLYLPQILSDAGKAYLYGSKDFAQNAAYFDTITDSAEDEAKFYTSFYSGRMNSKIENNFSRTQARFLKAVQYAQNQKDRDNAIWYYLDASLSSSIKEAIAAVEMFCPEWSDKDYFDDFFDTLSVRLMSQHMWSEYYQVANLIQGYASPETAAKYAYVSARLIQEKYYKNPDVDPEEDMERLFTMALDSGTSTYYKLMAASQLELGYDDIMKILPSAKPDESFVVNPQAEILLQGLIDFGFTDRIYDTWKEYSSEISMETAEKVSTYIHKYANENNSGYNQALRVAIKKVNNPEKEVPLDMLKLIYPTDFASYVRGNCKSFGLDEYLLYALIRSESFFDPTVYSTAGAKGLTQLMDATADDIAKKLKVAEYNLNDADTNVKFGSYYLSELISRLDGSQILAIFSYNGGITRVRSWLSSAKTEMGTTDLPKDIFLETIPYSETREYGRKVASSAAVYGLLYYDRNPCDILAEIMK